MLHRLDPDDRIYSYSSSTRAYDVWHDDDVCLRLGLPRSSAMPFLALPSLVLAPATRPFPSQLIPSTLPFVPLSPQPPNLSVGINIEYHSPAHSTTDLDRRR